jgi:tripeptidyl-peptidase-1
LLSQGKSPLGFLNPLLYSTGASTFNDVTSGNNAGCNTNGFTAKAGWDPVSVLFKVCVLDCADKLPNLQVSGLGTPNFGKLQAVVG